MDKFVTYSLLSKTKSEVTQIYSLESIENILHSLELQKKTYLAEIELQKDAVSELKSLMWQNPTGEKPKITLYEGVRGLRKVYEDSLALAAKPQFFSSASLLLSFRCSFAVANSASGLKSA